MATNHLEAFRAGIKYLRDRRFSDALPLLRSAAEDDTIIYANSALKYAIFLCDGNQLAEVTFAERSFFFGVGAGNFGLEMHHVEGRFFEQEELAFCKKLVPERAVIVDVGANTGNHVIFFAGTLAPSRVIAIEPVARAVAALRDNLALNSLTVDERGLGLAASAEEGRVRMQVDSHADLVVAKVTQDEILNSMSESVPAVRLDDLISERVDFMKIDVEGYERNVLIGAQRILSRDKPTLMIEVQDEKRKEFLEFMIEMEYKPFKAFKGVGYHNIFFRV